MSDTYSSIKTVLSESFKNFWSVLKPKIDAKVSTLDKKIDAKVSTLDTGYKLLEITTISFNASVSAGQQQSISQKFIKNNNASLCFPVLMSTGWGVVNNLTLSNDTVSFNFLNTTSTTHGCFAKVAVFQFEKFNKEG